MIICRLFHCDLIGSYALRVIWTADTCHTLRSSYWTHSHTHEIKLTTAVYRLLQCDAESAQLKQLAITRFSLSIIIIIIIIITTSVVSTVQMHKKTQESGHTAGQPYLCQFHGNKFLKSHFITTSATADRKAVDYAARTVRHFAYGKWQYMAIRRLPISERTMKLWRFPRFARLPSW